MESMAVTQVELAVVQVEKVVKVSLFLFHYLCALDILQLNSEL